MRSKLGVVLILLILTACRPKYALPIESWPGDALDVIGNDILDSYLPSIAPRLGYRTDSYYFLERVNELPLDENDKLDSVLEKWCISVNYLLQDPGRNISIDERVVYFVTKHAETGWASENLYELWGTFEDYDQDYEYVWGQCLEK